MCIRDRGTHDELMEGCEEYREIAMSQLSAEGVPVSVSIGVAVGRPGWSYEAYYRAADQALYLSLIHI